MFPGTVPIITSSYIAQAVNFDSAGNDELHVSSGLTGQADSKMFTVSFWMRRVADGATDAIFFNSTDGTLLTFRIQTTATNQMQFTVTRADGAGIGLSVFSSTNSLLVANGWQHIMASFDMSNTSKRHIYIDDVSDLATVTTYVDAALEMTTNGWAFGSTVAGANNLDADMADFMLWLGTYVDLSQASNRALFRTSTGKPVNPLITIGAVGTPIVAFYGPPASSWHTNKGSGGGFTLTGSLANVADGPSVAS